MVFLQTGQLLSTKKSREERGGKYFLGKKKTPNQNTPPPKPPNASKKNRATFSHVSIEILLYLSTYYSSPGLIPTYFTSRILKHIIINLLFSGPNLKST